MGRADIEHLPTSCYWSCMGGVEVKQVERGYEDMYIHCISGAWIGHRSYHCVKVLFSNSGRAYIKIKGTRLYLDECIKEGI